MSPPGDDIGAPVEVVVVDDAEEVRAVVVQFLSLDGRFHVVAEGRTGEDAVSLADRHRPSVMILDASMPDVDGLTALPAVLERSPATRVVVFSGFRGPVLEKAARALGAADVIDKATPVRTLARRLLQAAGRDVDEPHPTVAIHTTQDGDMSDAGAEAVLARHLERFRTVFDQGTIGMATMTLAGTIVRANPALCKMLGASEEELVTRPYAALAAAPTAPAVAEAIVDVASAHQEVAAIEHRLTPPGERWMRSTVAAVKDTAGGPLYLFVQTEEITDQRMAVEALRRSEERYRLLVEGVRDYAIFMLDPEGHVSTWSLGAERVKGYKAEEIIGRHFRVFYEEAAQSTRYPEHELELAIANGRYEEEGWRVRRDGTRFWANVVITALFDHTGKLAGFAKVTRDITERRRATEAREQFTAELESTNRLLKGAAQQTAEFVAMTAHELRSPIAAMTGAATILRDYWEALDATQRTEALNSMLRGGNRLRRLIEDLLTVSRLDADSFHFDLEVVGLRDVIDEVVVDQVDLLGDVTVECSRDLVVKADRVRCAQILANLLANAGIHGSPPVRVVAAARGPLAEVRVFDAGGGPPDAVLDRLFEKFVQGSGRDDRGTGLGLFIVRALACGQGGDAWYERDESGVQCFAFSLPLA
jgi:PAS domain S-box-containing protein